MTSEKNYDLDERMTPETKNFVKLFLSTTDIRAILTADINSIRNARTQTAMQINSKLKFDNLVVNEFYVDSCFDDFKIPVTAYTPKDVSTTAPLIVFCHGGGGVLGSRITYHHTIASIADQSNCIWLVVEYRLAPEFKFPFGHNDCLSVVQWVIEHKKDKFNCEPSAKIGLCGDSFGGLIAGSISQELRNYIGFQILIYPTIDMAIKTESQKEFSKDCYILIPEVIEFFSRAVARDEADRDNPKNSLLKSESFSNLPQCCIIAAELDPLRDHSVIYYEKLKEEDVSCEFHLIQGVHHGFFNIPSLMPNAFAQTAHYIIEFINRVTTQEDSEL